MKVQAIVAAGGSGERMGTAIPKPLLPLSGIPVVIRTLLAFEVMPLVDTVILVVPPGRRVDYQAAVTSAGLKKVKAVIPGGKTRTQSVREGLNALDTDADFVVVHDAVRPFVTVAMIGEGIAAAVEEKAAIAVVPVKPTLKMVDPRRNTMVAATLDRSLIREVQTPQVFERALLQRAYADGIEATDDSALVERLGVTVKVFPGSYRNIKITTPEDMLIAEAFMKDAGT